MQARPLCLVLITAACYRPQLEDACTLECSSMVGAGVCPDHLVCIGGMCQTREGECDQLRDAAPDSDVGLVCSSEVTVFGDAQPCVGNVIVLTGSVSQQAGAAWISPPYDLSTITAISIHLTLVLTRPGGTGDPGDGFAIVIQADPRGTSALGSGGSALGYGGGTAILPSLALEIDTNGDSGGTSGQHVAFDRNGVTDVPPSQVVLSPPDLASGAPFHVWLDYTAPDMFTAFVAPGPTKPGAPLITTFEDLSPWFQAAWIGVTAATGMDFGTQSVTAWTITVTP